MQPGNLDADKREEVSSSCFNLCEVKPKKPNEMPLFWGLHNLWPKVSKLEFCHILQKQKMRGCILQLLK